MSIPTAVDGVTPVDAALLNAYKAGINACEPALGLPASSGYLLSSDAEGGRSWVPAPSSSPTTAEGDLIVRGAAADEALPVGDEGQALVVASGVPAWVTLPVLSSVCDARLTLTTGVPVTTDDVIGASTIYLTRYRGAHVALWDGSAWGLHEVPSGDVSLVLSGLTAGKVYDVFLRDAAGTLTLSLSAAWSDGTTRTNALAVRDGVRVLASDHGKRLVGTFVATDTDKTTDAGYTVPAQRLVRNEAHPVQRAARVYVAAEARTYTTQEWRVWDNDANVVVQLLAHPSLPIRADVGVTTQSTMNIGARKAGVGVDSLSDLAFGASDMAMQPAANAFGIAQSRLQTVLTEGYHYLAPLEWALATGTCTWYGGVGNNMEVTLWA
jgi:hypothetical protein